MSQQSSGHGPTCCNTGLYRFVRLDRGNVKTCSVFNYWSVLNFFIQKAWISSLQW